ncbi:hypothetical protein PG993_009522 [Apiospora rasikravindrae]|uniref:NAD(P)-binding protein n=1 Tax=Apiospora rasikravindrae TaxID=990691 RepID=A0ABR1SJL8_9PEZI
MEFCPPESPAVGPADFQVDPSSNPALERFKVAGNAIVAGGGGDLGSTSSRALLQHGLGKLAIFDLDSVEGAKRVDKLKAEFPSALIIFKTVDITEADHVDHAVNEVATEFGSINILLNFAGTVCCMPSLDVSPVEWRRVLDVNTTGSFIIAHAVARKMIAAKTGGSIMFVASISGHSVCYPQPQAPYNTAKAAVMMLKSCLAAEWAVHGIRVNSISPGYMDTILNEGAGLDEAKSVWLSRNPLGRMGHREELSGVVVLLSSRAGSYINGSDIIADGGQTLF